MGRRIVSLLRIIIFMPQSLIRRKRGNLDSDQDSFLKKFSGDHIPDWPSPDLIKVTLPFSMKIIVGVARMLSAFPSPGSSINVKGCLCFSIKRSIV